MRASSRGNLDAAAPRPPRLWIWRIVVLGALAGWIPIAVRRDLGLEKSLACVGIALGVAESTRPVVRRIWPPSTVAALRRPREDGVWLVALIVLVNTLVWVWPPRVPQRLVTLSYRPCADVSVPKITPRGWQDMVFVDSGPFLRGSCDTQIEQLVINCTFDGNALAAGLCAKDPYQDETPQLTIYVDAFWIDSHEVTNEQFRQFANENAYVTRAERGPHASSFVYDHVDRTFDDVKGASWRHPLGPQSSPNAVLPVVHVTRSDAAAYCAWQGKRLPTEAEWEKAARGPDGRFYPWGNTWDLAKLPPRINTYFVGSTPALRPVGSFPRGRTIYGADDMLGNVWEWVSDWYAPEYTPDTTNPTGPAKPSLPSEGIYRGGSWVSSPFVLHAAWRRHSPVGTHNNLVGFRCVRDAVGASRVGSNPAVGSNHATVLLVVLALVGLSLVTFFMLGWRPSRRSRTPK